MAADDIVNASVGLLVGMIIIEVMDGIYNLLPIGDTSGCSRHIDSIMSHSRKARYWKMMKVKRCCNASR